MQLNSVINKNQWIYHLACFENDSNFVCTHSYKLNATKIIRKSLKIMQTRFDAIVVFFPIDEEKSLKKEFDEMIFEMKIIYESFALYISKQNDYLERKEEILSMKTGIMQIWINFSKYLWSWIVRVVDFIMNRTFMKNHYDKSLLNE